MSIFPSIHDIYFGTLTREDEPPGIFWKFIDIYNVAANSEAYISIKLQMSVLICEMQSHVGVKGKFTMTMIT